MMATKRPCECYDKGCPAHQGEAECPHRALVTLRRIDWADQPRVRVCEHCALDMVESGVFA